MFLFTLRYVVVAAFRWCWHAAAVQSNVDDFDCHMDSLGLLAFPQLPSCSWSHLSHELRSAQHEQYHFWITADFI